jgi:hypothetical protein
LELGYEVLAERDINDFTLSAGAQNQPLMGALEN